MINKNIYYTFFYLSYRKLIANDERILVKNITEINSDDVYSRIR